MKKQYFLFAYIVLFSLLKLNAQEPIGPQTSTINTKLKLEIKNNPNNIAIHQRFLKANENNIPYLKDQYKEWLKQYPRSTVVPYSIGVFLNSKQDSEAVNFLLKTIQVNPKYAEAWRLLGQLEFNLGNKKLASEYALKAKLLDPNNAGYAFLYAYSFQGVDPHKFDSLMLAIPFRFPESEYASSALYWLAATTDNLKEKMAFFERLYKRYGSLNTAYVNGGLSDYFAILLGNDPQKAFDLALDMTLESKANHLVWFEKLTLARAVRNATDSLTSQRPLAAVKILNELPPVYSEIEEIQIWKSNAVLDAFGPKAAFDSLLNNYARIPRLKTREHLLSLGKQIGKDPLQVIEDVKAKRYSTAEIASDFTLYNYHTLSNSSLKDFSGKVTLLTYWFPTCSPCLAEFPLFERVLSKIDRDQVNYVAINTIHRQDSYVLPLMKSKGLSFISLREDPARNKGNLDYFGVPQNYLIDRNGRIIFKDFRISSLNEDMLELMLKEMVD